MCWPSPFSGCSMLVPLCHCGYDRITPLRLSLQPWFQSAAILFAQELIHRLQLNFLFPANKGHTYVLFIMKYVVHSGNTQGPAFPLIVFLLPLEESAVLRTQEKSDYVHVSAVLGPHLRSLNASWKLLEIEILSLKSASSAFYHLLLWFSKLSFLNQTVASGKHQGIKCAVPLERRWTLTHNSQTLRDRVVIS